MAQKKRKKNPGVGVDFKRVKQKVGKKLAPAQNATDTSFKAKRINLPSQSLGAAKATTAVNEHNLTLKVRYELRAVHSAKGIVCFNRACVTLLPTGLKLEAWCRTFWRKAATTARKCAKMLS